MSGQRPSSRRVEEADAPPAPRKRRRSPLRWLRHDIGRKAMALAMALLLWAFLFEMVSGERTIELDVRAVATRQQADLNSTAAPAVYLVVPDDLIVRDDLDRERVTIRVRGPLDEVERLELSAVIEIDPDEIGDLDEEEVSLPLDQDMFRYQGAEPDLTEFRISPRSLSVVLAKRIDAEFPLGPSNVVPQGMPRKGYGFDTSRIKVRPNRVSLSGPRSAIEDLQNDNSQLKLEPVDIDGRPFEVSQYVGLDREKVDRSITLGTPLNVVEVTIPIQPLDQERELVAVPVRYVNEGLLEADQRTIISRTEMVDLMVRGPRSLIGHLSNEELLDNIILQYDWADADLPRSSSARLTVFRGTDLPQGIEVVGLDGRPPEIEYQLEEHSETPEPAPISEDTP